MFDTAERTQEGPVSNRGFLQSNEGRSCFPQVSTPLSLHKPSLIQTASQKDKRKKVVQATFEAALLKAGLEKDEAALVFAVMDADSDGGITLGDFNAATKVCQRLEAGLPSTHAKASSSSAASASNNVAYKKQPGSRDTSPRKPTTQARFSMMMTTRWEGMPDVLVHLR